MSHKQAKWRRKMEREMGHLRTGNIRQMADRYEDDAFNRAFPITDEMIEMLKEGIPESDLRYMQENGYRFSAERESFLSPGIGWFDGEGNIYDFDEDED